MFATGNAEKVRDAQHACKDYDVDIVQLKVDIDEIQHHNPLKITEHKAKATYAQVQKPIVVNDSFWSIPALGGFPGGYMKDVNQWFETEDFVNLMKNKDDKTITLTDVNGYYDGKNYRAFKTIRHGRFIDKPRGNSGPSFARVVIMEDDDITISEIFDQSHRNIDSSRYAQWHAFLQWYSGPIINTVSDKADV
jgi:XTP/dITP diphosphohydrolase